MDMTQIIASLGMELLAEQVAAQSALGDVIPNEVRAATTARDETAQAASDALERWYASIRAAIPHRRAVDIAAAAGIVRERVYQIRDGRR
jgi:hypothetical protein